MKELLVEFANYNKWANQKILEVAGQLNETQLHQEIGSSFSSIFKTLLHILDADSIWWQRMKLAEVVEVPGKTFTGNFEELQQKILAQSNDWFEWVSNATENQLTHVFAYHNTKKQQFKQPMHLVLLHLFNHSTYHHGQLITMFHQLGVQKLPATDFIVWTRLFNKK